MAASKIGSFEFVSMIPPPSYPREGLEFEARAGVAGYAAWKTGKAADFFQVATFRDVASFAAAEQEFLNYQTLVGAAPQTIHYAGDLMPYKVLVCRVDPDEIRRVILGTGGISGTSRGIVRAKWTLIPWIV